MSVHQYQYDVAFDLCTDDNLSEAQYYVEVVARYESIYDAHDGSDADGNRGMPAYGSSFDGYDLVKVERYGEEEMVLLQWDRLSSEERNDLHSRIVAHLETWEPPYEEERERGEDDYE